MRIIVLSDTHNQHEKLQIPDGDLLIHAGDFSVYGTHEDVLSFSKWMKSLPHQYKLAIPGNHDRFCEENMKYCKDVFDPIPFEDAGVVKIAGLTIFCYSWTPAPNPGSKWKFHPEYGDREFFARFWEYAPPCDILVTHGPPQGILDRVDRVYPGEDPNVGEWYLRQYVMKQKPRVHIFGHIHESYGKTTIEGTTFYNASICDRSYNPINPIFEIDLPEKSPIINNL